MRKMGGFTHAAGDIKSLIGESVEKVEGGSKLVSQAGKNISNSQFKTINVTTHAFFNRKANSKASFGLQKMWLSEFKACFEPYRSEHQIG